MGHRSWPGEGEQVPGLPLPLATPWGSLIPGDVLTGKAPCKFLGKAFAGSATRKLGQRGKGKKTMGFELLILSHFGCVTMKQVT